jgi:hypothetical protein
MFYVSSEWPWVNWWTGSTDRTWVIRLCPDLLLALGFRRIGRTQGLSVLPRTYPNGLCETGLPFWASIISHLLICTTVKMAASMYLAERIILPEDSKSTRIQPEDYSTFCTTLWLSPHNCLFIAFLPRHSAILCLTGSRRNNGKGR